ncbi:hypothetical protein [Aquihabitans sp. McL0605]|uniref:hypothetical protein n=1 Tax=Aquihabitans sp. McL0605 TaxID=3415671 RepID=UPI003CE9DBFA
MAPRTDDGDDRVDHLPPAGHRALVLICADGLESSWVAQLTADVAGEHGWAITTAAAPGAGARHPSAQATVGPLGAAVDPAEGPEIVVWVEAGSSRSPAVVESAEHLVARLELTVGAFKARRNQRVTRAALERFFDRVAAAALRTPTPAPVPAPGAAVEPAPSADPIVEGSRALLAEIDRWLARATMAPRAAQAIHADRAILAAAIGAPEIDLVIVERASARLRAATGPAGPAT